MKKPQDSTLRNTQAANKKLKKLFEELKKLKKRVKALEKKN